jgi:hypothetical protein
MPLPEPRIRAIQTQLLLRTVERLPTSERTAIGALVGGDALAEVDAPLPVAWHPMSLHMRLSDAIRDVVGPQRNVAVWEETMAACFERPILRGFVAMSTSLFGVSPLSLLRQADRMYVQLTRDLGLIRFRADGGGTSGVLALRGFPARRYRFICYVEGLMGCIQAAFPLANAEGTIDVIDHDEARGDVTYGVRWRALVPA